MADDEKGKAGAKGGQGPAITEVTHQLKGIHFPASKEDLLAKAKEHKAPKEVMDLLERFPDGEYASMADVMKGFGQANH